MNFTPINLRGAVVVVTGAARGIGFETARLYAARGAQVAIVDRQADEVQDAAQRIGNGVRGFDVDVTDADAVAAFVDVVEDQIGPVDVYVNNAGIMPVGPFSDEDGSVTRAVFEVNFWAHVHAIRAVAPRMVSRGRGHIVNVTSAAGRVHSAGLASYVASKHAATGFSRSLREELLDTGVSITAVMPSAARTDLVSGIPFGIERIGIVSPSLVARRIVGTLRRRPPVAGAPIGITPFLALAMLIPEWIWLLGRRIAKADRTMGPVDRAARASYDGRIAANSDRVRQVVSAPEWASLPTGDKEFS